MELKSLEEQQSSIQNSQSTEKREFRDIDEKKPTPLFTPSRILLIIMALFLVTLPIIYRLANEYFYIN